MFIDRAELLPEDESVQEHAQDKEDAAAQLTKDREGPGLFRGVFKERRDFPYMHHAPLRDFEDGVDRCPACLHEIEDGMCSGCGRPFSDYESESEDSIDAAMPSRPPQRAFYGVESDSDEDDTEDESNISGPDEYDRHDDFLDNEDEDDMDDLDEAEMAEADLYRTHRLAPFGYNAAVFRPIVGSDDDSNDDEDHDHDMRPNWMGRRLRAPGSPQIVSEDSATNYDESDEEEQDLDSMNHDMEGFESDNDQRIDSPRESSSPTAAAPPRNRRRPVVVSDDEDDGTAQEEGNSHSPRVRTVSPASDEDSGEDGTVSDQTSDSESGSDSEDSDNSESEDRREPQEVEDTEDSDDTILPPQSRHMRKQRLQSQRARRPHQHQARASSTDLSTPPRRDYLYDRRDDTLAQRGSRGRAARVY